MLKLDSLEGHAIEESRSRSSRVDIAPMIRRCCYFSDEADVSRQNRNLGQSRRPTVRGPRGERLARQAWDRAHPRGLLVVIDAQDALL